MFRSKSNGLPKPTFDNAAFNFGELILKFSWKLACDKEGKILCYKSFNDAKNLASKLHDENLETKIILNDEKEIQEHIHLIIPAKSSGGRTRSNRKPKQSTAKAVA